MSAGSANNGGLTFGFDFRTQPDGVKRGRRSGDEPFRILLLADLSGRAQRNVEDASDLGSRPCPRMDIDAFDALLMNYAPRIDWPIGTVDFQELDDFHPDQLYRKLAVFKSLRETRSKLKDPSTFAEMAQQLHSEKAIESLPDMDDGPTDKKTEGDVFSRLLGRPSKPGDDPARPSPATDAATELIRQIVTPYIVPAADPQRDQYIASVDMAIGDQMRAILHHPNFQGLEATWRGIWELVTGLELDENLELAVLDVTKQEVLEDLRSHMTNLTHCGLHRQCVDKASGAPDSNPWSVIIGHYAFEYSKEDIGLLAGLGLLASKAGAPFLADAHPSMIGSSSFVQVLEPSDWVSDLPLFNELRKSLVAPWIGLAAPRVLMRMPYGKASDEIEAFAFEELGSEPEHEDFLWGSSALACAKLLGTAFQEQGWSFNPENHLDLLDLPAYTMYAGDEKELQPCAEVVMSDRVGNELSRRGLMTMMSYRHRNAVRVRNIQSISDPPTALAGPWE